MKIRYPFVLVTAFLLLPVFFGTGLCAVTGNVEKVSQQYDLILAGQINEMLNNFSENATWTEAAAPFGGLFQGKTEIKKFFDNLFSSMNVKSVTTTEFFNSSFANKVIVLGNLKATVKSTNKSFDSNWTEVWTFGNDGKIVTVENYYDAAKMVTMTDAFKK
jgi:ketosteroid isomerase-like protein